jgi:hypothetical protein
MSKTVTSATRRVSKLPDSFASDSDVSGKWEHDIIVKLVINQPGLIFNMENVPPLRFSVSAFKDTRSQETMVRVLSTPPCLGYATLKPV